jgi:hypothetical protein
LFLAYFGGIAVAGALLFSCNKKSILAFYIADLIEYRHLCPINCLLAEVIRSSKEDGFEHLDLGTSSIQMNPNWSLIQFKESLGSFGVFRDTYTLTIN